MPKRSRSKSRRSKSPRSKSPRSKSRRSMSRRGSRRGLNPAVKKMSTIVKQLHKRTGISGPALMKEAGKIYRGEKSMM